MTDKDADKLTASIAVACARWCGVEDLQSEKEGVVELGKVIRPFLTAALKEQEDDLDGQRIEAIGHANGVIAQANAEIAELEAMLRRLEWPVPRGPLADCVCQFCWHAKPNHADNCELTAMLKRLETPHD